MDISSKIKNFFTTNKSREEKVKEAYKTLATEQRINGNDTDPSMYNPFVEKQQDGDPKYKSEFEWLWEPERGVRWDFDPIQTRNMAQDDPWCQMIITSIAKEIANTPWQIVENEDNETSKNLNPFEKVSKGKTGKQAGREDIVDFLANPNPNHDFTDLVYMWMADYLEVGSISGPIAFDKNDYSDDELTSNDPTPVHILPSDPVTWTKEFRDKTGVLDGFWQYAKYRSHNTTGRGGRYEQPIWFENLEVVWSDLNPRTNRRYGLPPTQTVMDIIKLLDLTTTQEKRFWSRGGFPAGMLKTSGDISEITGLKEQMNEVKGKPNEKILSVNDENAEWIKIGTNWKEMEMTEREKWYAKVIASAFQVPVSVVGLKPEDVNRATFQGERENFESNTLGPYLQKLERVINDQIIYPFFNRDIRFEFQPGMSENQKSSISNRVVKEFNQNLVTRNEARRQLGYEERDEDGFKDDLVEESDEPGLADLAEMEEGQKKQEEPLRETEDWQEFSYQPSDVEDLYEEIEPQVRELFEQVLNNDRVDDIIETLANDKEEKGNVELSRIIREAIKDLALTQGMKETILAQTGDAALDTLLDATEDTGMSVSEDKVMDRIQNRDMSFVDDYADRMEDEIRETVADGWEQGESIGEIKDNLKDKADEFSDYQARRISRTELQRSTSQARAEFADENNLAIVWRTAQDDRVRPADGSDDEGHRAMDGKWKRSNEKWPVPYQDANGTVKEDTIGSSKYGINCRCTAILKPEEELDESNHVGVLD